jgi:tetratricopeptide (TPR) repeat protein
MSLKQFCALATSMLLCLLFATTTNTVAATQTTDEVRIIIYNNDLESKEVQERYLETVKVELEKFNLKVSYFDAPIADSLKPDINANLVIEFVSESGVAIVTVRPLTFADLGLFSGLANHYQNYQLGWRLAAQLEPDYYGANQFSFAVNATIGLGLYATDRCGSTSTYFIHARRNIITWEATTSEKPTQDDGFSISYAQLKSISERYLSLYVGNCALLRGDYETAKKMFQMGRSEHRPDMFDPAPVTNLAWTNLQLGDTTEAFDPSNWQVIELGLDEMKVIALSNRAQLYTLANRHDEAIVDYDAAIALSPTNPMLYVLRAQTYLLLYEWDKVLADCDKAIEIDPTYAEAYYQRGLLYYSILQTGSSLYQEALADFEMYLDLAPNGEQAEQASQYIAQIEAQQAALGG